MTDQNTREMHYTILGYDLENLENSSEPKSATRKAFTSGFLACEKRRARKEREREKGERGQK